MDSTERAEQKIREIQHDRQEAHKFFYEKSDVYRTFVERIILIRNVDEKEFGSH